MVMTRIILILLLTVVSGSLHADWVNFGTSVTRTGNVTAYVNQTTIQKTGEKSKMWILYDSRIPRKFEKLAYKSQWARMNMTVKRSNREPLLFCCTLKTWVMVMSFQSFQHQVAIGSLLLLIP
jgi:hypothetical protein